MQVVSKGVGINEILISEISNSQKPYIIFKMPDDNGLYTKLKKTGLPSLGLTKTDNSEITITITSARKVVDALSLFFKMERYNNDENKSLFSSLLLFKSNCEKILEKKKPKSLPPTSKLFTLFSKTKTSLSKSNNETSIVSDKNSSNVNKEQNLYVFKKNKTGRAISEIEVFNAFCFQLLLGNRHPNVEGVHNKIKKFSPIYEREGVISKLLKEYISVAQYVKNTKELSKEKIIQSEMVKVWVASYCEEERDLHSGNYGFDHTGFCVKIDDDQSTWPLTSKYHGFDPVEKNNDRSSPFLSFPITERDILSFPELQDSDPNNWVFKNGNSEFNSICCEELRRDKKFTDDKFYMFLKRILIPIEVYEKIAKATIASEKMQVKFSQHKNKKTQELTEILLNMTEFKNYIDNNPMAIESIKNEFIVYNQIYVDKTYLHVNLEKIEELYKKMAITQFPYKN